ncbi:hypothetical protein ACZ91_31670 [Streptomyces regensis]|nr:hypothetical protein ACZ91_31670 [Streptomyces regensis]
MRGSVGLLVRQLAGDLLSGLGVVPEIGACRLLLEGGDLLAQRVDVHDGFDLRQLAVEVLDDVFELSTHE